MRHILGFIATIYGTMALFVAAFVLWNDLDFEPRRLAVVIGVGWLLLIPWPFYSATQRDR